MNWGSNWPASDPSDASHSLTRQVLLAVASGVIGLSVVASWADDKAPSKPAVPAAKQGVGPAPKKPVRPRILGDLLPPGAEPNPDSVRPRPPREPLDPQRAEAAGLRRLVGKHLTMYTDLPSQPAVDELPAVFDLAIAPWCEYFAVDRQKVDGWKMCGYLMRNAERFRQIGALPDFLPKFQNGFQAGSEFWWYEQPSDYYRRHLMLHEGTHAFMNHWLGGIGPPWYAEGMAELLATHRWEEGRLTMRYLPLRREEVPEWGRVKIVQDEMAAGRGKSLEALFNYDLNSHLQVETYGWCWAAAQFLDSHPRTRAAFRGRIVDAREEGPEFTRRMLAQLERDWSDVSEEWQMFVAQADYGYDVARAAVRRRPAQPLTAPEVRLKIAADAGWQSTGLQLENGVSYEVAAVGRYQIVAGPPVWWCEPGGVTIRYFRGQPLGMLLGAVRGEPLPSDTITPLAHPEPIGRKRVLTPAQTGTLYLKINEAPIDLADNEGELLVRVRRMVE